MEKQSCQELNLAFFIPDLVLKFKIICFRRTYIIEQKPNAGCMDRCTTKLIKTILDIRTKWCTMPCGGHIGYQNKMMYYAMWWPYWTSDQNELLCHMVAILHISSEWSTMSSGGHIGHQLRMKYYVMQWSYWIFGNISKSNPVPLTLLQQRSLSIISYENIPRICNISEFSHTFWNSIFED